MGLSATAELLVNFAAPNGVSGSAEARVVIFCIHVDLSSPSFRMTNYHEKGRGQGHMTHFQFQCLQSYLRNG